VTHGLFLFSLLLLFACVLFSFVAYASSAAMCVCVCWRGTHDHLSRSRTLAVRGGTRFVVVVVAYCFTRTFFEFFVSKCVLAIFFLIFFLSRKTANYFAIFPGGCEFFLCFRCEPKRNAAPRAGKQFSSMTAERLSLNTFRLAKKPLKNILAL